MSTILQKKHYELIIDALVAQDNIDLATIENIGKTLKKQQPNLNIQKFMNYAYRNSTT